MIDNIQSHLEKSWTMGFKDLRVVDDSHPDTDIEIYAVTFESRPDETTNMFTTRLGQMLSRLQTRFVLLTTFIDYDDTPVFAIVEFKLKDELK